MHALASLLLLLLQPEKRRNFISLPPTHGHVEQLPERGERLLTFGEYLGGGFARGGWREKLRRRRHRPLQVCVYPLVRPRRLRARAHQILARRGHVSPGTGQPDWRGGGAGLAPRGAARRASRRLRRILTATPRASRPSLLHWPGVHFCGGLASLLISRLDRHSAF